MGSPKKVLSVFVFVSPSNIFTDFIPNVKFSEIQHRES